MTPFTIATAESSSVKGHIVANVQIHAKFVRTAAEHGVDVVVFPELSLTGYEPELAGGLILTPEDTGHRLLHELSRRHDITIIAGAPIYSGLEKPHIGALVFSSASSYKYAKKHLHGGEEVYFSPGAHPCVLDMQGVPVGLAICADITHPVHAREAAAHGAAIYAAGVLITENGYGPDTRLMQGYTSDHAMLVVMANHSQPTGGHISAGKSAIWNEQGHKIAYAAGTEEVLVIAKRDADGWHGDVIHIGSK